MPDTRLPPPRPAMAGQRISVERTGGPDALTAEPFDIPRAPAGHAVVRNTAIGVHHIDVHHRTGVYPRPTPFVPGVEGAGIVWEAPQGRTGPRPGDRVGYIGRFGSYTTHAVVPADRLIPLPQDVEEQTAAAGLLHGITAYVLLKQVYPVQPHDVIVVHAAASGLGLLLCQWASACGATVIGTTSTQATAALARQHGATYTLLSADPSWPDAVRDITGGKGVPVVYDSISQDTLAGSLHSLKTRGLLVVLGQASGPTPPLDLTQLGHRGSLSVTRPSVLHFVQSRAELLHASAALFSALRQHKIRIEPRHMYALDDAPQAHRDLESRHTRGPLVLIP